MGFSKTDGENVLRGYLLVSKSLRYVAKKLTTLKDDEAIKSEMNS